MSKVTILIPIYNVEEYVEKCLKSLIKQTFHDFEIWAVDDGSPDNSKKIVEKYSKVDSRIKLIEKKNGGYGSVLQLGVNNVKSDYLLICDPDDWLADNALEKLYSFASDNNLDIAVGDKYNVFVDDGSVEYQKSFSDDLHIVPNKVYVDQQHIQQFSFAEVSPHAKLFRTENLKKIKFPKKVSYTDFVLYIMALANAKRVGYLNIPLAYYLRDRPGNTATDTSLKSVHYNCVVWKSVEKQLSQLATENEYSVLWFRMYIQLKSIINEYGKASEHPFADEYSNEVKLLILLAQKYKNSMKHYAKKSLKSSLFFNGLMNKYFYKEFALLYIKLAS